MPEVTYFVVRFEKVDGNVELWEHMKYEDAKNHFDLFDDTDRDIYTEIALIERDWKNDKDTVLERKVFE